MACVVQRDSHYSGHSLQGLVGRADMRAALEDSGAAALEGPGTWACARAADAISGAYGSEEARAASEEQRKISSTVSGSGFFTIHTGCTEAFQLQLFMPNESDGSSDINFSWLF